MFAMIFQGIWPGKRNRPISRAGAMQVLVRQEDATSVSSLCRRRAKKNMRISALNEC
jgi:hypothetical protein